MNKSEDGRLATFSPPPHTFYGIYSIHIGPNGQRNHHLGQALKLGKREEQFYIRVKIKRKRGKEGGRRATGWKLAAGWKENVKKTLKKVKIY
jgi:hypothetical protein